MQTSQRSSAIAIEQIWPASDTAGGIFRLVSLTLIGSLLLTLSAKLSVPFYPVPMTFQTAVVFLIGIACGRKLGLAIVLAYLAEGAIGLPVFSGTPERGLGLAYMAGPTGGYLLGFIAAVMICGHAGDRGWRGLKLFAAVLAATLVVFVLGAGYLSTLVGFETAITAGVVPFLPGAVLKLAIALLAAELGLSQLKKAL